MLRMFCEHLTAHCMLAGHLLVDFFQDCSACQFHISTCMNLLAIIFNVIILACSIFLPQTRAAHNVPL